MMIKNNKEWLDRQLNDWAAKGWVTAEGRQKIRQSYEAPARSISTIIYGALAVVTLAFAGIGVIWGLSYVWYHISPALRMAVAVLILLLSQCGVVLAVFQDREGTWIGEGVSLAQCTAMFVSLALVEHTFYIGWDVPLYVVVCAVLSLPAAYMLRSVAAVIAYGLAVLAWAALSGPVNAPGGAAFLWLLLALPLPMYYVFVNHHDERRLAIFSWAITITVFVTFALATRNAAYIPFLLLSALAAVIMLTGYSIDIRKSWGVPFRWFGRFAAAASLLISCMPAAWHGIADIQGFHWSTMTITVILFLAIIALLAKGVKKRFWGPVIYSFIPFILLGETMIVRSGLYSSVPLIVSSAYMMFLGFYEIVQGVKEHYVNHVRFGVVLLACLVLTFIFGAAFSPLVPLVVMVILALAVVQYSRTAKKNKAAEQRAARRLRVKHTAATLRQEQSGSAAPAGEEQGASAPKGPGGAEGQDEAVPEWMKDIRIPPTSEPARQAERPAGTVIPKAQPQSQFVPPVFHSPDDIALPSMAAGRKKGKTRREEPKKSGRVTSSPWQKVEPVKREKHFSRSPWSQEGERKK